MRITNKVMQNNALTNINRNKELQDTLNTELATGKKVDRPSDDPVVAIRALRLRSDVSQVTQYSGKNVPDAENWLNLTESSVNTTVSVIKDIIEKCEKGSSDTLKTSDRKVIIDSLKELRDEIYATGNSDYAGRYIFTGYRTDTPLTFQKNTTEDFKITQLFNPDDMQEMTYVTTKTAGGTDLLKLSETVYDGANQVYEQDIESYSYHRIRLAYDKLTNDVPEISLMDSDFNALTDGSGTPISITPTINDNKDAAYKDIASATGLKAVLIPSTGELLMSKDLYDLVKSEGANISVDYHKSSWIAGDLMPQHYFPAVETDTTTTPPTTIKYNYDENGTTVSDYYKHGAADQDINYQVGFGQNIRVNTTAHEIFSHDIGRDVDEIIELANYLTEVEDMQTKLKTMSKDGDNYTSTQLEDIKKDLEAADKAVVLLRDQLQKRFSNYITKSQGYLSAASEALTTIGNRGARLKLVKNRLDDQTTTLKTLQSRNEDADATEVAVQLSSAQVSYQAALMATSDMIKETLLNYL